MQFNPGNTNIAVIGGGNIGTQFACVCASKGYKVNVLSSKPELYDGTLEIIDENDRVTTGNLNLVSSDIGKVVKDCQIIFVTHPARRSTRMERAIRQLSVRASRSYVSERSGKRRRNNIVCGGVEFSFRECIKAGAAVAGLQRVPSVARLIKYGKRVRCEGIRPELFLASIPTSKTEALASFISDLWGIPCHNLPNYLSVTLTPSNPILHTSRLRTLFADYYEGKVYEKNTLFYGEWSDESSDLLIKCDQELQDMLKLLDQLDLTNVKSLKLHYESDTVEAMTKKLRSIKSLHNLSSPMIQVDGGYIPDFKSRYFTADFPYGLAIIEELAALLNYNATNIKDTMRWYRKVTGDTNRLDLAVYGIITKEDIYKLYQG